MTNVIRIVDRTGVALEFHPISFRYKLERDCLMIDIAGIDHVLLMELDDEALTKLTKQALDGSIALKKTRARLVKDRGLG